MLVLRPDHLGDFVLTLPAIAALRRRLPDAVITCMVPDELMPIARRAVDVDAVLPMPLVMTDPPAADASRLATAAARLRGRFDLALLPRPNDPWSGALVAAAAVPLRVGHPQPGTLPFLTHAFGERESRHVARESVALALRAAALLSTTRRFRRVGRHACLRLMPQDHAAADRLLARFGSPRAPVVVHPVTGWPLKSWPAERWTDAVAGIGERLQTTVLIVGQAADRELLTQIVNDAGHNARAVAGIPIATLAGLHAQARIVIGVDSGALHLASLLGAPVVGLFGPFSPSRTAPLGSTADVRCLWRALPCSPCGTLEHPPCGAVRDPACLLAISAQEVVRAAVQLDQMRRR